MPIRTHRWTTTSVSRRIIEPSLVPNDAGAGAPGVEAFDVVLVGREGRGRRVLPVDAVEDVGARLTAVDPVAHRRGCLSGRNAGGDGGGGDGVSVEGRIAIRGIGLSRRADV